MNAASATTEVGERQKVRISPNPVAARGVLQVEMPADFSGDKMTAKILDLEGKAFVCGLERAGQATIRVFLPSASLPSGIYFLTLEEGARTASGKFEILRD